MRKIIPYLLAVALILAACGEVQTSRSTPVSTPTPSPSLETTEPTESAQVEPESQPEESSQSNILIAYFTLPENVNTQGVDAISGASIMGICSLVVTDVITRLVPASKLTRQSR